MNVDESQPIITRVIDTVEIIIKMQSNLEYNHNKNIVKITTTIIEYR